jgi:pimeloyl-ACP methyl ester carboxylesterase
MRRKVIIFISCLFFIFSIFLSYLIFPEFYYSLFERVEFWKINLKSKKLKTKGHTFSYAEGGEGKTLLFVHGFQSGKHFWLKYAKKFSSNYHIVIPDLPAHGGSSYDESTKFDISSFAEYLNDFVEEKGFEEFYLIGTSLGAGISISYAYQYPEKVKKLVLLNPIGIKPECEKDVEKITKKNEGIFFPNSLEDLDNLYFNLVGRPFLGKNFIKKGILKHFIKRRKLSKKIFFEIIKGDGIEKILDKIKPKTLVIMGRADKIVNFSDFDIYKKNISDCDFIFLEEGHHVFMDNSLDRVISHLGNFFER